MWSILGVPGTIISKAMAKLFSFAIGVFPAGMLASAALADGPDISAQRLLASWHDEDPGLSMIPR